jgi:hypothetical protein
MEAEELSEDDLPGPEMVLDQLALKLSDKDRCFEKVFRLVDAVAVIRAETLAE